MTSLTPFLVLSLLLAASTLPAQQISGGGGSGGVTAPNFDILSPEKTAWGGTPNYAVGKQIAIAPGTTITLLNITGSGYVSHMWMAMNNTSTEAGNYQILKITVDGNVTYNDLYGNFFGDPFWNDSSLGHFATELTTDAAGQGSYIPIPYSTSLEIQLTSNEPSSTINFWYNISYISGVSPSIFNLSGKLNVNAVTYNEGGSALVLTQDQVGTLMNATGLAPGRLLGISLLFDGYNASGSASSSAFLEGPLIIYCDGNIVLQTSGSEDYFGMAGYFGGVAAGFSTTQTALTNKRSSPILYAAVRFHLLDPITFQNALKVTWQAGLASTGNTFTGSVTLYWTIWYYTTR